MDVSKVTTLLGCVPLLGTAVGIGRIATEIKKAREEKTQETSKNIFETLKTNESSREEIFHGACELVPIAGPLLYGAVNGARFIAKKIHALHHLENTLPAANPSDIIAFNELKNYVGKPITICVTHYAYDFFSEDYRNAHKNDGDVSGGKVRGTLISVSDKPVFEQSGRYAIVLRVAKADAEDNNLYQQFYISEEEMNTVTQKVLNAKEPS